MAPVLVTASQLSLYRDRDERSKLLPAPSLQGGSQGQLCPPERLARCPGVDSPQRQAFRLDHTPTVRSAKTQIHKDIVQQNQPRLVWLSG